MGQQRPGQPTVVVERTTQRLSTPLSSICWGQMLSRQNAGGTTLVMVGQAAIVTGVVWTGHPEGITAFWAIQWVGAMMLEEEFVSCNCFKQTVEGD